MSTMRCTRKFMQTLVLVLVGLLLSCGLGACSKEETRRILPAERAF